VTCDDLQTLRHGYVDGEVDLVRHLDIEQHLAGCPDCARACKQLQVLQGALRGTSFRFAPPPGLRRRIESSLRDLDDFRPRRRVWPWLALAASAAMIAVTTWSMVRVLPAAEDDRLALEVVSSHVRSLMIDHLYDVKSSDRHAVKPWFHGKIDFAPPVVDLAGDGFPLSGGRLDYLDGRPVAILVYHRRQHVINLLIWPSARTEAEEPRALTRQGYQLLHWSRGGMTYWAISDLNPAELRTFADLIVPQASSATPRRKGDRSPSM
jgi:anti-sigma factor RsiW